MRRRSLWSRNEFSAFCRIAAILFASALPSFGVDHFGDIVVAPQSLTSGETYHGYREFRVLLQNQSLKDTHRVTLIYPDRAYNFGNAISRMSRTVSLGPGSQAMVPFWQPPLPANGNGLFRVLVDDENAGTAGLPDIPRHLNRAGPRFGGSQIPAVILVSRSLNYDDVNRAFNAGKTAFSADMAVGPPDSGGRRGVVPTAWMPDSSSRGPHWLELDYDNPISADRVRIYETMDLPGGGEIVLTGVSGTNLARIQISTTASRRPPGNAQDFSFALTPEPVKTVRLNFGTTFAGSIGIDAVELEGPSAPGGVWASAARASSESKSPPPRLAGFSGFNTRELLRSEIPITDWSEHWLSYTPYDAVILSGADAAAAPPAVMTALWRYTECGGNLVFLGGGEVPKPWRSLQKAAFQGFERFTVGFGQCFRFANANAADLEPSVVKVVMDAADGSARIWQALPDENGANSNFPVVKDFRVPVRSTVFLMLLFIILIGPVNIFVLSRLNRRTWLLWTIPAISFVTCLMVFGYTLLREGVTPDVRTDGVTLLDQPNHRAVTVGITAFYCPLTPSQGLIFGYDTEATPLVEAWNYGYSRAGGTLREVDWTSAQHLQRGWVTARVPAHFELRRVETRRERLQLESANGQTTVLNGLGAPIRSLWLTDDSGAFYTASDIPAGQKAVLTPPPNSPNIVVARSGGPRALLERLGYYFGPMNSGASNAPAFLLPGTYIAELDSNPFLENGLGPGAKSSRTRAHALVYGILDNPAQP